MFNGVLIQGGIIIKLKKSIIILFIIFVFVFLISGCVSAAEPTKVRITKTPTGGPANALSSNPSTSADGRYVAFESYATNLGPGGSGNGIQDIYVYDSQNNAIEWITKTPYGGSANGASSSPSISADGRYVAFVSTATNLGPGGSGNGIKDIFVYDRINQIMKWITKTPTGGSANGHSVAPSISANGRYVAFQSTAKNLGPGGSDYYTYDIYVCDTNTNTMEWITKTAQGKTANGGSFQPSISADGRYVAFESIATNLGSNPYIRFGSGNGIKDIFVYDRNLKIMSCITNFSALPIVKATPQGGPFTVPFNVKLEMNQPGTIYWSYDGINFSPYSNPILIDHTTYLYFYGESNNVRSKIVSESYILNSDKPIVWASPSKGTYYDFVDVVLQMNMPGTIYYSTDGSNPLLGNVYSGGIKITTTTTLRFIGITSDSKISTEVVETYTILESPPVGGYTPALSNDGSLIAYQSGFLIFVYNKNSDTTTLITKTATGGTANDKSYNPSISGNGRYVAFETYATNLGIDPTQIYGSGLNIRDIFIYDRNLGVMNYVTKNLNYGPANGSSYHPSLNGDGSVISYQSFATNLGPGGSGETYSDIFLEKYGSQGTTTQPPTVSVNPVGGTYSSAQTVTLTTTDPDSTAITYYTRDGSDPQFSATRISYTTPIQILASTVLRYIAVDPNNNWSPNYTQIYTINISTASVSIAQLKTAASYVKSYYETHSKTLPANVQIDGNTLTMPQLLYLLTTATIQINSNNLNPITIKAVNPAPNPSGSFKSGTMSKAAFISVAQSIQSFINTNGRAPNYKGTTLGNMPFKYLVYMYSKILNFYAINNRLPNSVSISR